MNINPHEVAAIVTRALEKGQRIDGLWSLASIAKWCEISERKARELVKTPGFPIAFRLPSEGPGEGRPRWKATEVIAWESARKPPFVDDIPGELVSDWTAARLSGVYVLSLKGRTQYVGESQDVAGRIGRHLQNNVIQFDRVHLVAVEGRDARRAEERALIRKLLPVMQGAGNKSKAKTMQVNKESA